MIKVIPPGSFDFNTAPAELIKVSAAGLIGSDLTALIKRAGHPLADEVRKMTFLPGEVPVHYIAMGASEKFGCNRNFDAWSGEELRKHSHTFEKYAKPYRDHRNKPSSPYYGVIKKAFYNPEMCRTELIISYNATKDAAARNGGEVADREINLLEGDGAELSGSMATKQAFDVCSSCGNKAKTRANYCDSFNMCKHGGLKRNIGKVFEDGHLLHTDNPSPVFFDFSSVSRPADRTAFCLGKVASGFTEPTGGAELAEVLGITDPGLTLTSFSPLRMKLAQMLSAYEYGIPKCGGFSPDLRSAFTSPAATDQERRLALKALAEEKIALALDEFLELATGMTHMEARKSAASVAPVLPGLYRALVAGDVAEQAFDFTTEEPNNKLKKWAFLLRPSRSFDVSHVRRRAHQEALSPQVQSKSAAVYVGTPTPSVSAVAGLYAAYQLAFLEKYSSDTLTAEFLVAQNRETIIDH